MEGSRCLSWLFLREEGWNRGSLFALAPDTVQPVLGAFFYLFFLFIRVETGCMSQASGESPLTAHPPFPYEIGGAFRCPQGRETSCTPQATAVVLAQLGEGDSPQCG